ncbi:glycosyltransferase family 4 protein [Spirosoma litoris]
MNIFFDHQAFSLQNYGGISRYYCELIKGINKDEHHNAHLSLLWSNNIHLHEYKIPVLPYPFPKRYRLLSQSNKIFNIVNAKLANYDVYHATYFSDFLKNYTSHKPYVTTFYDMTYERLSHQFVELSADTLIIGQKKKIAQYASHLIAISESTKRDMVDILNIDPKKITVIYLSTPFSQNKILENTYKINKRPYLLFVGNRTGYKNFIPFLRSIAYILIRYQIVLVCAGGGSFTSNEHDVIRALSLNGLVEHQLIDDTLLPHLYDGAIAFVFPSLYEGFGIPILEAFSCNCPCIVSNTSSFPEVAGKGALYFDPTDSESMATNVERVILDDELRNNLIQNGQQQLRRFSWQHTVNETLGLYENLI